MRYLLVSLYHPKPGCEKEFLAAWEEGVKASGALSIAMHQNVETGEFLATSHWNSPEKFLESQAINDLCLIPPVQEIYDCVKREPSGNF